MYNIRSGAACTAAPLACTLYSPVMPKVFVYRRLMLTEPFVVMARTVLPPPLRGTLS